MSLSSILFLSIIFITVVIIVLCLKYFNIVMKEKYAKTTKNNEQLHYQENDKEKITKEYTRESIFNFMEFDKIENNMIVQKKGKKFLMVIECQGINYDLMSDVEKTAVEKGFIQFLNTLRNSIQIYIQTRTINLEDSLKNYKERLKKIESELILKETKYKAMVESGQYTDTQLKKQMIEVKRQNNLYNYGRDIVFNTEKMSLNKNVLRKKYYVIISYYFNESEDENFSEPEIIEVAFADLYTKAQSIIRTLSISGVNGKVLNSYELIDLLYNAYNREEAENYGISKAQKAGFDDLYITAPDVLEKKMNAINKTIESKALELAQDSVKYAKENLEKDIKEKEENMNILIEQLANQLIEENEGYLGKVLTEKAKKKVKNSKKTEKGVTKSVKKSKIAKKSIASY